MITEGTMFYVRKSYDQVGKYVIEFYCHLTATWSPSETLEADDITFALNILGIKP